VQILNIHRSTSLGIRIGRELDRGLGYGKKALGLALNFCWNHLNLNRVQLTVLKPNQRAVKAYVAVGFKKEGIMRKAAYIDGERIDLVLMAALRPSRSRPAKQNASAQAGPGSSRARGPARPLDRPLP
jgi:RimJ/RimL family protein N-acetyltransferase